jgi:hypothetical protein
VIIESDESDEEEEEEERKDGGSGGFYRLSPTWKACMYILIPSCLP